VFEIMASKNKRKKYINSYCEDSIKNSYLKMKLKRILFYTGIDRRNNKKINIED
jgi:hypothetical protein